MKYLVGLFQIFSVVFLFIFKCIEQLFMSLLFALPFWLVYTQTIWKKFDVSELTYLDFVMLVFCFQLLGVLWSISTKRSNESTNEPNLLVKNNDSNLNNDNNI